MDKEEIEFFEKMERYLEGTLSEPEVGELEKQLKSNLKISTEAELNQIIIEALKNRELLQIKDDVDNAMAIVKEAVEPLKKKQGKLFPFSNAIFKIAAVISLLIISILVISKYLQSNTVDAIIISYLAEPYQSPAFYKATEKIIDTWKQEYQSGKYSEVINILQNETQTDSSNWEARFYLGLCYLYQEKRDPTKAIDQFSQILTVKSRYNEQAMWFLGLSYYLAGNQKSAINTLKKVKGSKIEEAENLLKRLR